MSHLGALYSFYCCVTFSVSKLLACLGGILMTTNQACPTMSLQFPVYIHEVDSNELDTVHSQLSQLQWVPDYPNPDYSNSRLSERLDVTMFSAAAGKWRPRHWSFATGECKPAVRTTFPRCYNAFSASMRFRSRFTMSELADWSRKHCSTLYYSVAN